MQKNSLIAKRFFEMNERFEKVSLNINSAKNALIKNDIGKFDFYLNKAVATAESSTLALRETAKYCTKISNFPNIYNKISEKVSNDVFQIDIQKNDFGYKIQMPITLEHFGEIKKSIIDEPLNNALKQYFKKNKIEKFDAATIVVVNNISEKISANKIRDNDNYEYKQIVNSIAFWFLPDDSFKCCNIMNCTKISQKSNTDVYVIKNGSFGDFVLKNKELFF